MWRCFYQKLKHLFFECRKNWKRAGIWFWKILEDHLWEIIWDKVFKNRPSKICGRQPFKNFTWSILEYFDPIDAGLNSVGLNIFKKCLLSFKRPFAKSIFDIHNPYAIKLLIITHLSLSMFQEYIVRHCFQDTLNLLIDYGVDNERVTALSPVR